MKIIFLDVDGVLNFAACEDTASNSWMMGVNSEKVALLKHIVDETDAKIVLSSTWKTEYDFENGCITADGVYLNKRLAEHGLEIMDVTPGYVSAYRGAEIRRWLDAHPEVESWIAIDDDIFCDFEEQGIMPRLVHTTFAHGLTEPLAEQAIDLLNGDKK